MKKILDFLKTLKDKWKSLSKATKISIVIISVGLITSLIIFSVYSTKITYSALFYDLQPADAEKIREKLVTDKVSYKLADSGTTILVPKDQVDDIRLSLYSDSTILSSDKGYELFDQSNFGMTDTEAKVQYQRALQGELERTIKGFDEVAQARVHLVMPEDSVFTKDTEKATASVTLKLKGTSTLTQDQVKAIISLMSGSVKDLPKENVQVVDSNMNLLSDGLFDSTSSDGTVSASKQQDMEKQFEGKIQGNVKNALEEVFGKDKVSVTVNADLDFDSTQISTIKYDNTKIERSQKIIKETTQDTAGGSTGSSSSTPVDNNMQNTISNGNTNGSQSTHDEETTNYEIPQTQETVVKAPGEIKRMTVSVIINGDLNLDEKNSIKDIVAAATGYDNTRGDVINVAAYHFNTDIQDKAKQDLAEMNSEQTQAQKIKLYEEIGIAAAGVLFITLLLIVLAKKRRNKKKAEEESEAMGDNPAIDVVVSDTVVPKQQPEYQPVLSEEEEMKMNLEKELQGYANKKPDQVIDVIKSWLSEDER